MKRVRSFPPVPSRELNEFVAIVRRLRRECPWDRKQTHKSLRGGLIEETYEVVEALDSGNTDELRAELGDLLLHVILQATIAEQKNEFSLRDVLRGESRKLIYRHPHVFGTVKARSAQEVVTNWQKLKMAEGRRSVLDGVPPAMPALLRALRVQQRAAKVGFDWENDEQVWAKVKEEVDELGRTFHGGSPSAREAEFGDMLFALVNYARFFRINPEQALRRTIDKFTRRFHYIERELKRQGKEIGTVSLAEMDELWNEAKRKKLPRTGKRSGTQRSKERKRAN